MSPQQVREERRAAQGDVRPVPGPLAGSYRPWDEAGRPERHEVQR